MWIVPRLVTLVIAFMLSSAAAYATDADYKINPGDVLQITVWKEDGMDRETLVLPDGTVNFPLIGTMRARGLTVGQTAAAIKAGLAKYIPNATVTVVVKAALGNVVDVIGQVNKPGELQAGHRMTIMQALSLAGGLTPYAAEGRISVLRHKEDGSETSVPFKNYNDLLAGTKLDKDIELEPGDVVVVPAASLF
jgi:polysaccharide export outer membrane protein